ncbi:MAG: hypothetical protein RBR69_07615 [Candidatus Cloacimonadaceae bacterium]|jgi:hypothetical protein|nr:hypothetical protein [Candidatus Cloacimonadota bacterium]MCK9178241.1 hypothetical protein [Candidatus Cloacimonadota bacterium]MDD3102848.1 hypothetical protein [Candidatus Cloacimonadota bacterium]MDD3532600.1 hypothetical protein [Candidatus Cloacimonadota bacterium]MDY0127982.1 hypothetical protein [Candidatus Cloacimonadaceae bacterium]
MKRSIFLIITIIFFTSSLWGQLNLSIETELGAAFSGYNDIRSPNEDNPSPLLSLTDDLKSDPAFSSRLQLHYRIHPRHQISLLAAPLRVNASGTLPEDIIYEGESYDAGKKMDAFYRFDSYRLQYRYFFPKPLFVIKSVGISGKIRDAEIELKSDGKKSRKTNTGAVPLLSLNAGYHLMEELELILEAEGLASPYGRAEDVYLGLDFMVNNKLNFRAGYRFLEGGSDIDEVYTFSAFHYATIGFSVKL